MKIPKIEYSLYYPLYDEDLIELNMSKCKGQKVDITILISIKNDIEKYNQIVIIIIINVQKQHQKIVLI